MKLENRENIGYGSVPQGAKIGTFVTPNSIRICDCSPTGINGYVSIQSSGEMKKDTNWARCAQRLAL